MFTLITTDGKIYNFHVNDEKPLPMAFASYIQADGDELELIRTQFDNLPITRGNICDWSGSMAQFIFSNMIL